MFTVIIPYYQEHAALERLIKTIPVSIPVIVVNDQSPVPLQLNKIKRDGLQVLDMPHKGYFTGAVNYGIKHCKTDVLVLNQDVQFVNDRWVAVLQDNRNEYALIGERIKGDHPAWGGYIHGTFMYARRDAVDRIGLMDERTYPLWGSTCEWQARFVRKGYKVLMLAEVPGMVHQRERGQRFGNAITAVLSKEPDRKTEFIQTPPMISVIVPCRNYGRFLPSLVNSLIGGKTDLGETPGQTFQSFEIVIVDDGSDDGETPQIIASLVDRSKGIRSVRSEKRVGTAEANNIGVRNSYGRWITVIGADDMMESQRLERLINVAWQNPHSIVYDNIMSFADGARKPDYPYKVSKYDFERLLERNHIHCGIIFPRQAWAETGGYPAQFANGREDWAFNVSLGRAGYCGIFVDEPMYLYRREKHNRSLRNGSKRQDFLAMMVGTFPDLYGGYRPVGCCGGARSKTTKVLSPTNGGGTTEARSMAMPGQEGMVLVEYIGASQGAQSWYGAVTGTRYEFGLSKKVGYVDRRDLQTSKVNQPGFLDVRKDGKNIFRLFKPVAVPQPVPQPIAEVPTAEDEPVELKGDDLTAIKGVGEKVAGALVESGIVTFEQVAGATDEDLKDAGVRSVKAVRESARELAQSGIV